MDTSSSHKENTLDSEEPVSFGNEHMPYDRNESSQTSDKPRTTFMSRKTCYAVSLLLVFVAALTSFLVLDNANKTVHMEDEVPLTANTTSGFTLNPGLASADNDNRELGLVCPNPRFQHAVAKYDKIGVWRTGHSGVCNKCPSQWQTCFERSPTAELAMENYLKEKYGGTYYCETYHINTHSGYWCDSQTTSCLFGCQANAYCNGGCEYVQDCHRWCL
mmetsp:Transcript_31917/g.42559  ORF Transcript_31917/g.42559 Transcript_31917/m.42559 type:complete len:218 (-) Transcript_31917:634-1287(-)